MGAANDLTKAGCLMTLLFPLIAVVIIVIVAVPSIRFAFITTIVCLLLLAFFGRMVGRNEPEK